MGIWNWFFITLGVIIVVVGLILAIRFFRKMYYMIEEMDARLIQLRKMLEGSPGRHPHAKTPQSLHQGTHS